MKTEKEIKKELRRLKKEQKKLQEILDKKKPMDVSKFGYFLNIVECSHKINVLSWTLKDSTKQGIKTQI